MNYPLLDFLISLASSNGLQAYSSDPDRYMESFSLSEKQKHAVRSGDLYRIRRWAANEMPESLHAQLLIQFYEEQDPEFKGNVEAGPTDVDDANHTTEHNIVQTHDLGDDIAEIHNKVRHRSVL